MQIKAYQKVPVEVEIDKSQQQQIVDDADMSTDYLLKRLTTQVFNEYMMNVDWNPRTAEGRRLEMKDVERGMWLRPSPDYDLFSELTPPEFDDFIEMTPTEKDFFETMEALENIIKTFALTK